MMDKSVENIVQLAGKLTPEEQSWLIARMRDIIDSRPALTGQKGG